MKMTADFQDPSHYIRQIHVAGDVATLDYTREICQRAKLPVSVISAGENPPVGRNGLPFAEMLALGKKHLYLCRNRGDFFKPCPGTAEYQCCRYQVLNVGMNCPMDCVYCILQAYLNQPWITAFVNIDDLFREVDAVLSRDPSLFYRIGTGEFADSLALERITGMAARLSEFFGRYDNVLLELKTKSGFVANLKEVDHRRRTLLSWSLNSQSIMKNEEIRSASLEQRLAAAKQAADWGYGLSFHFDPIVMHRNWQKEYEETVNLLFDTVPNRQIVWISLGALRYLPQLKDISLQRFPRSLMFREEFVAGLDGKRRYFRSLREEMYSHLYQCIRRRASEDTCIYFCMESDEIWHAVCGFTPKEKGGIPFMLDDAARRFITKPDHP